MYIYEICHLHTYKMQGFDKLQHSFMIAKKKQNKQTTTKKQNSSSSIFGRMCSSFSSEL